MSSEPFHEAVAAGSVVLTVNQRLARHHVHRHGLWQLGNGATWWETPRVLPWSAWLAELHDTALAAGLSTRVRVPGIVQQRFWRRALGAEASEALLDPDAAAAQAARARQIGLAWRCLGDGEDYPSHDQLAWRRWSARYVARCEAEGLVDDAALSDHLVELVVSHGRIGRSGRDAHDMESLALPARLLLAGFLQEPPQQRALIEALTEAGVVVERLTPARAGPVRAVAHADDEAELRHVASEVREALERSPDAVFGVVVPDLAPRRAAVRRAFDRAFFPGLTPNEIDARERPYDLSLGLPLADQPLVRTALSLLRLMNSRIAGGELSALLMSPYLAGGRAESTRREQLDRRLREARDHALTLAALCDALDPGSTFARGARELLAGRASDHALPSTWAARFGAALHALGWPGERSDSEEYQIVQAWHGCLQDLQMLDDGESIGEREALAIVVRLARERVFQPESPPVPIQIMGRLESHGIAFDRLWVTGLDSESWPPAGAPIPFLPIAAQKAAGLPEASVVERLALAEREFALWRSSADELVASHALERGGQTLLPAAVLAEPGAPAVASAGAAREPIVPLDPLALIAAAAGLERLVDERGPVLEAGVDVRGGARLLEDQASCPFRAFALHRLHVRPLEEGGIGLDPRQRGTLLHAALERFWVETGTHARLMALDDDALAGSIAAAVAVALDGSKIVGPLKGLEQRRLERLLGDWIVQCERPRMPFAVVAFEEEREIERVGLRMTVKLDRVDDVAGRRVVIDYKSGAAASIGSWSDLRVSSPQLPLYVLGDDAIEGASFAKVVRHGCAWAGVTRAPDMLPGATVAKDRLVDWADWRRHWSEALDAVAAEVRAGDARVAPRKGACAHCELTPLCRIAEAST